jgi:hypothetical protein
MSAKNDLRQKTVAPESSVLLADSLNNRAVLKLQLGNYYEARKLLVYGISLLKELQDNMLLKDQTQNEQKASRYPKLKAFLSAALDSSTTTCSPHTNYCRHINVSTSNQIVSIPLLSNDRERHFESVLDDNEWVNNDDTNIISVSPPSLSSGIENEKKQKQYKEQLKRSKYYNAAFYLPSIDTCSSVREVLIVIIFNAGLTYQKEGMDGRSSAYHKAMYLYKQILFLTRSLVQAAEAVDTRQEQQHSSILLVVLAACHNIGFVCKQIGQPKLYRTYIEAGTTLERKIHYKYMAPHDREFFSMNRFFARYYEHSSAEAA